jgi:hypothetical protein
MKHLLVIIPLLFACESQSKPTSDTLQKKQQEQLSLQAAQSVGMPAITNFQEKRMLKMIYELRDTEISTTTYIVDLNGKLHKLCKSIGYGFPYATQFTNPMRVEAGGYGDGRWGVTLPQADPNGLFSPASADGSWVMCLGKDDKVHPVYVEPRVIVSPIELETK